MLSSEMICNFKILNSYSNLIFSLVGVYIVIWSLKILEGICFILLASTFIYFCSFVYLFLYQIHPLCMCGALTMCWFQGRDPKGQGLCWRKRQPTLGRDTDRNVTRYQGAERSEIEIYWMEISHLLEIRIDKFSAHANPG